MLVSKVMKGSAGANLLSNALWPPNFVGRTTDQSAMHCWGQRSCRVSWGQVGVNLLGNILGPPNFVGRIPDQSIMHCWDGRLCRGQLGSIRLAMSYGYQIWWEEPLTRALCIAGVKGHVGVSWGQVGVKLLSNALWPPNFVGRTTDQS